MALDPTILKDLIVANVEAATGNTMPAISQDVWAAVAAAIITHITTAGVVVVAVASVSGVTAGIAVSGPGAGTGTIT